MPKELPQEPSIFKRKLSPEVRDVVLGVLTVEILVWAYVISAGIRDLRRETSAINFAVEQIDARVSDLEDRLRRVPLPE